MNKFNQYTVNKKLTQGNKNGSPVLPHNTHLEDPGAFSQFDPHLRQLNKLSLVHRSDLISRFLLLDAGIYTVSGGRQVGKTTLLKQWMAELIRDGGDPVTIAFTTGELIDDHHSLARVLSAMLSEMPDELVKYLIVDEVTYIWPDGSLVYRVRKLFGPWMLYLFSRPSGKTNLRQHPKRPRKSFSPIHSFGALETGMISAEQPIGGRCCL